MRVVMQLKGLHKTSKKLADGTRRTYYYAWAGGPRMLEEQGTPAFIREFEAHKALERQGPKGTYAEAIVSYKAKILPGKARDTRRDYLPMIAEIELEFGTMPLPRTPEEYLLTRQLFNQWLEHLDRSPRASDKRWGMLSTLCTHAIRQGLLVSNPCAAGERQWNGSRRDSTWSALQIGRFRDVASPQVRLVFDLALDTGQRQKDLLQFTWSQFDGERINVAQAKRGKRVSILLDPDLAQRLRALPNNPDNSNTPTLTICATSRSTAWTGTGFRASFNTARKRAGIEGVTFHDLRGTAVCLAARDGADAYAMASRFGWTQAQALKMMDKHYLTPDQQRADEIVHLRRGKK